MKTKTKSTLVILGTLLVGIIIGGLGTSVIFTNRLGAIQALRMQGGLTNLLENVIEPVDEVQREQIREIVRNAAEQQMELRRTMFEENRLVFEGMREELEEVLTDEQKARLRRWMVRERRDGPGFRPPDFLRRPPGPGGTGLRRRAPRDSIERRQPPP